MSLQAGTAARQIMPNKPLFLCGYPHVPRTSTGVHDPLWVTALYLKNKATTLLVLTLDLVYVSPERSNGWRQAIRAATGVPEKNILIGLTHTHSGPNTIEYVMAWTNDPTVPPPDEDYMNLLGQKVVEASVAAKEAAIPAELAVTTADGTGVGGNRIIAGGIIDPEVGLLAFRTKKEKKLFALSLVYSMHPTVLHEDSTLISSDFPHYTRVHLQERWQGLTVLYHQGSSGNQSPRHFVKGQTFAEAERLGRLLGERVHTSLQAIPDGAFSDQIKLSSRRAHVRLERRKFLKVDEAKKVFEAAVAKWETMKRDGSPKAETRSAECAWFGAERKVIFAEAQERGAVKKLQDKYTPMEVQVLQIGDTMLAGIPGELYVEFALDLKKRAAAKTFVITLANGDIQGYVVTREAEEMQTYESGFGIFTPKAGTQMADAAVKLIGEMVQQKTNAQVSVSQGR